MRRATLIRTETGDDGTFGLLTLDNGMQFYAVELPWRANQHGISCIPAGTYLATWRDSPNHGLVYHVEKVNGRDGILIHAANWAGDESKGYVKQLEGCVAPGNSIQDVEGKWKGKPVKQKGVTSSGDTLRRLEDNLERKSFELTVRWKDGVNPEV